MPAGHQHLRPALPGSQADSALFLKAVPPDVILVAAQKAERARHGLPKIRCPKCRWEPSRDSRWFCASAGPPENFDGGCMTEWNTFDTRGECPGCHHQWKFTSCLSCAAWSAHDDWYVDEDANP